MAEPETAGRIYPTAYQTGNIEPLEHMERVVTTIHDLIGDYNEMERKYFQPATPADIDEL